MPLTYKDFELNEGGANGDAAPWHQRENQLDMDIIDTLVGDCISNLSDTTGHKHSKLRSPDDGSVAIQVNPGSVYIGGGAISNVTVNVSNASDYSAAVEVDGDAVFQVNGNTKEVKVGATSGSYPTRFVNSDVYTRNIDDLDHTVIGFATPDTDIVKAITRGGLVELFVNLVATSTGPEASKGIALPFTTKWTGESGDHHELGSHHIYINSVLTAVDTYLEYGNILRFSGIAPSGDIVEIKSKFIFSITDPDFTNQMPI